MKSRIFATAATLILGIASGIVLYPIIASGSAVAAVNPSPEEEAAACGPAGCAQVIIDVGNGTVTYVPFDPVPSQTPEESTAPDAAPNPTDSPATTPPPSEPVCGVTE